MQDTLFRARYRALNASQREAVDAIEGPVMVIAGPGTGKTEVLTLRIANILRNTDVGPDAILALTFTQSGVQAMRERLVQLVGPAAYRVHIYTFHGFANEIIHRYPEHFARIIGGKSAEQVDQIRIIERAIFSARLSLLRPLGNPRYYCVPVRSAIDRLKREGFGPRELAAQLRQLRAALKKEKRLSPGERSKRERELAKLAELTQIYRAYEVALREEQLYDYGDMVMELVAALSTNHELLLTLREEYLYLLADEHQDANQSQNRIIELLVGEDPDPNLFLVGDDRQAIYQFQGASVENFLYFSTRFPRARVIELTDNYRSSQRILDAVHTLAPVHPRAQGRRELVSRVSKAGAPVRLAELPDEAQEAPLVSELIGEELAAGTELSHIAILYRENRDAARFAQALNARGIAYRIESDASVLDDPRVRAFVSLLRGVSLAESQQSSELLFMPWLTVPLHLRAALLARAAEKRLLFYSALAQAQEEELQCYANELERWSRYAQSLLLPEAVQKIFEESGAASFMLRQPDSALLLERMAGLYGALKRFSERHPHATLADFVHELALYELYHIPIPAEEGPVREGVRLMTAHRSKGLEFDSVYLVGALEGRFGGRRSREVFALPLRGSEELSGVDDERRLFYVALTRARQSLTISYARTREGKAQLPAQFISELRADRIMRIDTSLFERSWRPEALLRALPRSSVPSVRQREYVEQLFLSRELSVTHLNNYLRCPWHYFFVNLLRMPEAKTPVQCYGTAVHRALHQFGAARAHGARVGERMLLRAFTDALAQEPLSDALAGDALTRGRAALAGYYHARAKHMSPEARQEWRLRGPAVPLSEGQQLTLGGVLDRYEGEGSTAEVTDFKTRAPLSRNEILGLTASSDGSYIRQLLFYKLLIDGVGYGPLTRGVLDFVEPNERGIYKHEAFDLDEAAAQALRNEIVRVGQEIVQLAFWERRCGEEACPYCALRATLDDPLARIAQRARPQRSRKEHRGKHRKER